ncbi:MAG: TolC family protein, partial [Acidobacteriota bacterium]|nr:TolC family protein [Acidobacteriota bacterium]
TLAEADWTRADGQIAVARSAEAAAREAVRIARELAAEGRGGLNDLEGAQIALGAAREQVGNAGQALLAARLRLLELRGDVWR